MHLVIVIKKNVKFAVLVLLNGRLLRICYIEYTLYLPVVSEVV